MGCAGGDDGTVGDAGGGKGSGDCMVLSAAAFEPIAAAAFEPGDATSCFASHASLAASSLDSAVHAYSVPSLHISAIEISSAPHAGASPDAAAAGSICCGGGVPCVARCCDGGGAPCGGGLPPVMPPGERLGTSGQGQG